MKIELITYSNE